MSTLFYRNIDARDLLDTFLVSAISSLLLLRFYLHITGYPQVGGDVLHIAHMLYGGMFMMIAIVINLTFLGSRARWASAIIGGVGFGIFIDELGKFITQDNNYFFQPTIGLIYAIFVVLYLTFNFLTRKQRLRSSEYQMNVLSKLEEAVAYDLNRAEKADIKSLLEKSDQHSVVTKELQSMVDTLIITSDERKSRTKTLLRKIDHYYALFWRQRNSKLIIKMLFILEVLILVSATIYTVFTNVNDVRAIFEGNDLTYGQEVLLAQVISAMVAGGFVLYGIYLLSASRIRAFEQFRRAALINIYLTQFFVFVRLEFQALPGLIASIILLILISFVIRQERRLGKNHDDNE